MGKLFCREASIADLPAVLRLYAQPDLDDGKTLSLDQAECIWELMRQYPDYRMYVAIADETIVGTFALLIMHNLAHQGDPSAIVEDVAVDPEWQGQGIGRMMMQCALDMAAGKGCYKVVLSSNLKRERAHAFYEALNFERHGYSFRVLMKDRKISPQM